MWSPRAAITCPPTGDSCCPNRVLPEVWECCFDCPFSTANGDIRVLGQIWVVPAFTPDSTGLLPDGEGERINVYQILVIVLNA